jgi:hypothetical protein
LHEGKFTVPDPAFFGVSGTVLGGMEQSVLSHCAHIRNSKVFNQVEMSVVVVMA